MRHLTKHNVWSTEHYGLRTQLNTASTTYKLTTEILNAMNNKLIVGGIFCDAAKVFDGVNHNHNVWLAKLCVYCAVHTLIMGKYAAITPTTSISTDTIEPLL